MESPPISQDDYTRLVRLVDTFPSDAGALMDTTGVVPAPGSRAEREIREFPDDEGVETSLSLGAQAIEHSADHMYALAAACTEPVAPFAAFTLARGVLESAAIAVWLFDTEIGAAERVERGMSLRHAGLEELRKLTESDPAVLEYDGDASRKVKDRFNDMLAKAIERGVEPRRNRKGQVDGFGAGMPRRLDLVKKVPGGGLDYRLFSAVSHGHSWALISVRFKKSDQENFAVKHVEPTTLDYVCFRAIEFFARALWAQVYLHGWPSGPFALLLEETYDSIRLAPERRFWRAQATAHA